MLIRLTDYCMRSWVRVQRIIFLVDGSYGLIEHRIGFTDEIHRSWFNKDIRLDAVAVV